jgi:hypothetical protein
MISWGEGRMWKWVGTLGLLNIGNRLTHKLDPSLVGGTRLSALMNLPICRS